MNIFLKFISNLEMNSFIADKRLIYGLFLDLPLEISFIFKIKLFFIIRRLFEKIKFFILIKLEVLLSFYFIAHSDSTVTMRLLEIWKWKAGDTYHKIFNMWPSFRKLWKIVVLLSIIRFLKVKFWFDKGHHLSLKIRLMISCLTKGSVSIVFT